MRSHGPHRGSPGSHLVLRWALVSGHYVASQIRDDAYRPTTTAGCQSVGDTTLAGGGGGGAFLRRVRGPFRLGVCRSRDFHRSSLTTGGGGRGSWLMMRLGCGGDRRARPCPGGLSRRRGLVLRPQSVRPSRWRCGSEFLDTIAVPGSRSSRAEPPECRPVGVSLTKKKERGATSTGPQKTPAHYRASPIRRRQKEVEA